MAKVRPDFTRVGSIAHYSSHWCAWRLYDKGDGSKIQKIPCKARGKGQSLASTSSEGWLSFEDAQALYKKGGFDGVGVLLLDSDALACIDIDNCLDDAGNVIETAAAVVSELANWGSYIEVSQSGHGVHCFIRGFRLEGCLEKVTLPGGHSLEVYDCDSERYMTVTGKPWKGAEPVSSIEQRQGELEALMREFGFIPAGQKIEADGVGLACLPRSDAEVLGLLMQVHNQKGRITRLLNGDASDHDNDMSAANLALCGELAFITRDVDQIDRLFRQSGAMRSKWDSKRGGGTWGSRTIRLALKKQTDSLDAFRARKASDKQTGSAIAEALKAKGAELLAGGLDGLTDSKGRLRITLHTVVELLLRDKQLTGAIFFDEFKSLPLKTRPLSEVIGKSAPNQAGELVDADLIALTAYLSRTWGFDAKVPMVKDAVELLARMVGRNPVTDKLNELAEVWDGKARLQSWLVDYCRADTQAGGGKDITKYVSAVGARFLIQAVARAYQPGVQADSLLILEGRQGARKSTAVRVLCEAVAPDAFLGGFSLGSQSEQHTLMSLAGKWLGEWGELANLTKHEAETVKNFLTRPVDTYKMPYDRLHTNHRRTITFVASTNEGTYLRDLSGNRRMWPVKVGVIDIDRLRQDAGQIIGEAVHQYRAGARWWIDEHGVEDAELQVMATAEQRARLISEAWDELGMELAEQAVLGKLEIGSEKNKKTLKIGAGVAITELMKAAGLEGVESDESGRRTTAFSKSLRKAGWENFDSNGRRRWRLSKEAAEAIEKGWR